MPIIVNQQKRGPDYIQASAPTGIDHGTTWYKTGDGDLLYFDKVAEVWRSFFDIVPASFIDAQILPDDNRDPANIIKEFNNGKFKFIVNYSTGEVDVTNSSRTTWKLDITSDFAAITSGGLGSGVVNVNNITSEMSATITAIYNSLDAINSTGNFDGIIFVTGRPGIDSNFSITLVGGGTSVSHTCDFGPIHVTAIPGDYNYTIRDIYVSGINSAIGTIDNLLRITATPGVSGNFGIKIVSSKTHATGILSGLLDITSIPGTIGNINISVQEGGTGAQHAEGVLDHVIDISAMSGQQGNHIIEIRGTGAYSRERMFWEGNTRVLEIENNVSTYQHIVEALNSYGYTAQYRDYWTLGTFTDTIQLTGGYTTGLQSASGVLNNAGDGIDIVAEPGDEGNILIKLMEGTLDAAGSGQLLWNDTIDQDHILPGVIDLEMTSGSVGNMTFELNPNAESIAAQGVLSGKAIIAANSKYGDKTNIDITIEDEPAVDYIVAATGDLQGRIDIVAEPGIEGNLRIETSRHNYDGAQSTGNINNIITDIRVRDIGYYDTNLIISSSGIPAIGILDEVIEITGVSDATSNIKIEVDGGQDANPSYGEIGGIFGIYGVTDVGDDANLEIWVEHTETITPHDRLGSGEHVIFTSGKLTVRAWIGVSTNDDILWAISDSAFIDGSASGPLNPGSFVSSDVGGTIVALAMYSLCNKT